MSDQPSPNAGGAGSAVERDRQILVSARQKGKLSTFGAFFRLSGPGWLQAATSLGSGSPIEGIGSALSWFLFPPVWPGVDALARASGVDLTGLLTWLLPSGLILAITLSLTMLYLGWLVAYWNVRSRPIRHVARAA